MSRAMEDPGSMEEELYTAVTQGDLYAVQLLIQDGADVCWHKPWPSDGDCALHQAALQGGDVALVEELLRAGAQVSQRDDRGRTALHNAAIKGHVHIINCLLAAGANCNQSDFDAVAPLHLACSSNYPDAVRCLLEAGAEPNRNDDNLYSSPLIHSASYGHLECVKVLLEKGADVNWMDHHSCQAVHAAALGGHEDCLSYLVTHGSEIDLPDGQNSTPLFHAADQEHLACMDVLVTAGADCICAAQHAASKRQWRTVEVLLQYTDRKPPEKILLSAITDVRLSTIAQCVRRGVWAEETDVMDALVPPILRRGVPKVHDAVDETLLQFSYSGDRLTDLVHLLALLYEVGLICTQTLKRQCKVIDNWTSSLVPVTTPILKGCEITVPASLKIISGWLIRRCVRGRDNKAYGQLGLPTLLVNFLEAHHIANRYKSLPAIQWDDDE